MKTSLSNNLNKASGRAASSSSAEGGMALMNYKFFAIQETDRADTLLRLTVNEYGHTVKAEMPNSEGILKTALVRWHQLKSELSTSAFEEISEAEFDAKMKDQFSDMQKRKVLKFSTATVSFRPDA